MTRYILDTSALRSIGRDKLVSAVESAEVTISPFSVWELFSHLDEPVQPGQSRDDDFRRRAGQVLKCQEVTVLDDPFAEHALEAGAANLVNPTRFDDARVIPQVLERLQEASSLSSFYDDEISYSVTERGSIRDSVDRCRGHLAEFQKQYCRSMLRTRQQALKRTPYPNLNPADFVSIAAHGAAALADQYREDGVESGTLVEDVFASIYPYVGYRVARLLSYENGLQNSDDLHLDENDAEDAAICLHLDTTKDRVLVTNDKSTRKALQNALKQLCQRMQDLGFSPIVMTRVLSADDFLAEVLGGDGSPFSSTG